MNENLKAFMQKVSEDGALQAKLTELSDSVMSDAKAKFIKLGEECGYSFTEDDMDHVTAETEKLSEDELEAASGGKYKSFGSRGIRTDCACIFGGGGVKDELQKDCACVLGGCGELTALGKQKADKNEIKWQGDERAKVALACAVVGQ